MQVPSLTEIPSLAGWLKGRADQVLVVSPHLDDAGLSLAETLRGLSVPAHAYTVFTAADENTDTRWAHQTGFRDAYAEYAARREEDAAAMAAIGIPFSHGGIAYGDLSDAAAARMIAEICERVTKAPTLTLLPLGAGGVASGFDRLFRRVLRRPFGSPVHSDHVWVRDRVRQALSGPVGYYAEIPYHWSNSRAALSALAAPLCPGRFGRVTQPVDADFKHRIACLYASQITQELGDNPAYQRKVCAADEILFLPL